MASHRKPLTRFSLDDIIAWAIVALLAAGSGAFAFRWSENAGHARLADVAVHQLDLYAAGLESELSKYESLPSILELNDEVFELLDQPQDAALAAKVNSRLLNLNVRAGSLGIALMDEKGTVVASSGWYEPNNLIGKNLAGEAFYADAVRTGQARTFVVGSSRGAPESYFSRAITRRGHVIGVIAVRVSLEAIESAWIEHAAGSQNEKLLVVDSNGVVIMSSNPVWRYRTLTPLPAQERALLAGANHYPAGSLEPLQLSIDKELEYGAQLVQVKDESVPAADAFFISQDQEMARPGWRLITLLRVAPVEREARNAALGAMACGALIGVFGLYLRQRRRTVSQQLASRAALQRANDELEHRVEERTGELRDANVALVSEVAERRRTEDSLRKAQDELVEAGRLALLGKMSAAITHEINQPLTALRALADNGVRLLKVGRMDDVEQKFKAIGQLTERMGRITQQLKSFAYKTPKHTGSVRVGAAITNVLELLRERIHDQEVEVDVQVAGCQLVVCDGYRLEQVLLNLFGNAMDAMKGAAVRRLSVSTAVIDEDRTLRLRVTDTGTGLPQDVLDRMFEPFFTTKPPGEGLGLGLVLSSGIVREFGSSLRASNLEGGGAVFEFDLKMEIESEPTHV